MPLLDDPERPACPHPAGATDMRRWLLGGMARNALWLLPPLVNDSNTRWGARDAMFGNVISALWERYCNISALCNRSRKHQQPVGARRARGSNKFSSVQQPRNQQTRDSREYPIVTRESLLRGAWEPRQQTAPQEPKSQTPHYALRPCGAGISFKKPRR